MVSSFLGRTPEEEKNFILISLEDQTFQWDPEQKKMYENTNGKSFCEAEFSI